MLTEETIWHFMPIVSLLFEQHKGILHLAGQMTDELMIFIAIGAAVSLLITLFIFRSNGEKLRLERLHKFQNTAQANATKNFKYKWIAGKRCAVTGGSGFLGRHLVETLRQIGCTVRIIDIASTYELEGVTFIKCDLRDKGQVFDACQNVDIVFHCATPSPFCTNMKLLMDVNVIHFTCAIITNKCIKVANMNITRWKAQETCWMHVRNSKLNDLSLSVQLVLFLMALIKKMLMKQYLYQKNLGPP